MEISVSKVTAEVEFRCLFGGKRVDKLTSVDAADLPPVLVSRLFIFNDCDQD